MKKAIVIISLFLMAGSACADYANLPDLGGETSSQALSTTQERQLGEEVMRDLRSGMFGVSYFDDPDTVEYIGELGRRLVLSSPAAGRALEFFVLEDPSINAMALPGGFIGVHTGLITAAQTESELASVLSHEIAHISQRHIARAIMRQKQMQPLQMLALAFALALAGGSPDAAVGVSMGTLAMSTQDILNHTREFEREADRVGFQILQKSGFNAVDYVRMFDKMHKEGRIHDTGFFPAYLRTHPMGWERMADIQNLLHGIKTKPVLDSVSFHLVRVKLQFMAMNPKDAVAEYRSQLSQRRYLKEYAAHYGAALAYYETADFISLNEELSWFHKKQITHPMIGLLSAKALLKQGRANMALTQYQQLLKQYPASFSVLHDAAKAYLNANQPDQVIKLLKYKVKPDVSDPRLFECLARAYALKDNKAQYHAAMAESYARRGNYHDALTQMEMAQRNAGGSFYEQSINDARLREFRDRFKTMMDSSS